MADTICTTPTLDEDIMPLAKQTAPRNRISLGSAGSALVRPAQQPASLAQAKPRSAYTLLCARGEVITSAHVYRLMDDEGI
jgi:hypothetical protein